MLRFFLSLKTAFGFFFAFSVLLFLGSLIIPNNLAFFSGINDVPLFRWLFGAGNLKLTWWIYMMIFLLGLLAVSTIFCTAEGLLKGLGRHNIILKISPQVMHIGVLFIMLGHLLTASMGFKADMLLKKGDTKAINGKTGIYLEDVKVSTDESGYDTDWEARLWRLEDGVKIKEASLRPAHPLYFGGVGIYFKSVSMETGPAEPGAADPSVLVRVCRDPGALWALIGGIVLSAGGLGFIYGRFGD